MAFIIPTVSDFKAYFTRDFPYGATPETVNDSDIEKTIEQAGFNFNSALFETQAQFSMAYMYLMAHYLVMDLRMAAQGVSGQYSWLTSSKSVGSVSEGFSIPQQIMDHPTFSMLTKTNYGAKYLSLVLPQMVGQMFTSMGTTLP